MKKKIAYLLMSILVFGAFSCENENNPSNPNSKLEEIKSTFSVTAFNLLEKTLVFEEKSKNICLSPLSIEAALMMTLNGAEGITKQELLDILQLNGYELGSINASYRELHQILNNTKDVELSMANAIFWDDNRISLFDQFRDDLENSYDADLEKFNFNENAAVNDINAWVAEKTENRIKKILEFINNDEAMFLINALYLKADWALPFLIDASQDREFTLGNKTKIQVPSMFLDETVSVYYGEHFESVRLDFVDSIFSMYFILPQKATSPIDLVSEISSDQPSFDNILSNGFSRERAIIQLPKFEVKYHINLKEVLVDLGASTAFSELEANFPHFGTAAGNIFLSRVLHDSYLKVDEKGVEGAAVTTVGIGVTSLPRVIDFNRPFLYLLKHRESQSIIFLGIVQNPIEPIE